MNDTLLLVGAFVVLPLIVMVAVAFGSGSINLLRQSADEKKRALERLVLFVSGIVGLAVAAGFGAMPVITHGARGAVAILIATGVWWFLLRPRRATRSQNEPKA